MAPRWRRKCIKCLWTAPRRPLAAVFLASLAGAAALARPASAETLQQALARAYENNPQLNAQRAIVRQNDEQVSQALSGYRPTISANASLGREWSDTKQVIPPTPPLLPTGATFEAKGLSTPRSVG